MADDFIGSVYGWDILEISLTHHDTEEYKEEFLQANIRHRATICRRINQYESLSAKAVADLRNIGRNADLHLVPIEDSDVSRNPGYTDPKAIAIQLSSTPQTEHKVLYTILAFCFGVAFLIAILTLAVFIPDPKPFQVRAFTTVMAIAAAGTATVMTGLINTQIKLGTQLVIGATGALAVFVIVYMVNPAVIH
jgi:VIT1/CCC1 family predicted Fe2+/Mn2+ transporter